MIKHLVRLPLWSVVWRVVCAVGLVGLVGCASDSGAMPPAGGGNSAIKSHVPADLGPDALRIGEMIMIEFTGVDTPPARHEERIKTDGKITLPSIGPVQAAGKTRGELEETIHNLYVPGYYRQLTVIVRNEGRFFYVDGQVKNPNQFPYLKEMTVLKAISTAGGFTDFAKKKDVLVTRADGRRITINCDKALHHPELDVPVFPDDRIMVPRRYW